VNTARQRPLKRDFGLAETGGMAESPSRESWVRRIVRYKRQLAEVLAGAQLREVWS